MSTSTHFQGLRPPDPALLRYSQLHTRCKGQHEQLTPTTTHQCRHNHKPTGTYTPY